MTLMGLGAWGKRPHGWGRLRKPPGAPPRVSCEDLIAALRKHGTYSGAGREVGMANSNVYVAFNPSKRQPIPRCHKYTEEAQSIAARSAAARIKPKRPRGPRGRRPKHSCEEIVRAVMVHKTLDGAARELGYNPTGMGQLFFGKATYNPRCGQYARLVRFIIGPEWARELMR